MQRSRGGQPSNVQTASHHAESKTGAVADRLPSGSEKSIRPDFHDLAAQRELEDSFKLVPHIIWTARPDGSTDFINEGGSAESGTLLSGLVYGWDWLDLVHPEDVDLARRVWEGAVTSGEPYRNEYRVLQEDGSFRWFLARATAVRDSEGRVQRWIGTWTDIDELGCARERANHDATLLANVRDSIIVTDLDCIITFWNKGAERVFGWTADEMIGRPLVERYPPESRAEIAAAMRAIFDGNDWSGEYEDFRKDGSRIWIDARVTVMRNDRGIPLGLIGICHDISERKQNEQERERLIAVIEASPDFIGIADENQQVTFVNPAGRELVGLSSTEAVCQTRICDYFSDEEWRRVEPLAMQALRDEQRWDGEVRFRNFATGQEIPVRWNPFTIKSTDGGSTYYACVARDLTGERANEESRLASERRFREFMKHSPIGAWITDCEGHILYLSEKLLEMCPHLAPEDIGKTAFDIHPADLAAVYRSRIQEVADSGEPISGVEPGPRLDGSMGEHMVYRFPIPTPNGGICVGGVSFDVTEQRKTEKALRLRDRAIQAVAQGITIADALLPDNPLIYVSPGFLKLTGYDESEVLGKNCRFLSGPETSSSARRGIREAIRNEESTTVEILNYRRDGSQFWNEVSIAPVYDSDGQLTHYVGVQTDITERRLLEDRVRQSQKMEAIGQLADGIAHDFNNLMTVVIAHGEAILYSNSLTPQEREGLLMMVAAGEKAANLTKQLLAFSKSHVNVPEVADLNKIVRDMVDMLRCVIRADFHIVTMLANDLQNVIVDPGQISRVVLNLAINARDAMPNGGELRFETTNVAVSPEMIKGRAEVSAGDFVLLKVSDSGHGMTPDVVAQVFDPYFSTKEPGAGTGLGLSVIHGAVSSCGGFVSIDTGPGIGTTFSVFLPATDQATNAEVKRSVPAALPRGSETIMVVEDELAVRKVSSRILKSCGYRVIEATNSDNALLQLRSLRQPIDLLITDIVMPGIDGQRLSDIVLTNGLARRTLLISGYAKNLNSRAPSLRGREEILMKPFSPAELAEKVRTLLDTV